MPSDLDLYVEITKPSGVTFRWDPDVREAAAVPTGISFSTKRQEGFERASCVLHRRIDVDWPDLELYDDFRLISGSGEAAYEGRVSSHPRQLDGEGHSVQVEASGWMAHARDRKFRQVYVDRDFGRWSGVGVARQAALVAANFGPVGPEVRQDDGAGALVTEVTAPWISPGLGWSEGVYDAGPGVVIGKVYYAWTRGANISAGDSAWDWHVAVATDDLLASSDTTGDLTAAGPGTGTLTATAATRRYATVSLGYTDTATDDGRKYTISWTCLAVYGDHGLTTYGTSDASNAPGVYASDVITNIVANWCPKLNVGGVTGTTYAIPHSVFADRTDPYDAFLEINKHHLWDLAVWEDRTLHYGPVDLTDWDWEIRLDDPGTTVELQGDSAEDLANGIVVEFDNVATAKRDILTPDDTAELADTSETNPVNRHGLTVWTELSLSSPTTADAAAQIGRTALAEFNAAKSPGSIGVTGHVRDRQGIWQPGWKVRAGDTLVITDHPNDRVRLISETGWNADSKQLTIAVDSTIRRLDAFLDRTATALVAANLS